MTARRRSALSACLALAIGCGGESKNNTLVVVEVESDLAIPTQLETLEIVASTDVGFASRIFPISADTLPVSLGVVPEGKTGGRLRVVVTAWAGGKATLVQHLETAFVPNEARKLSVFLTTSCLAVSPTCGTQTCRAGRCVDYTDGVTLTPFPGGPPPVEGGPVMTPDATTADATTSYDAATPVDVATVPTDAGGPSSDLPPAACGRIGEACCPAPAPCNGAGTCTANVCQCTAPAIMCAGACVNPTTNPNHCRTCNHSCQGGACVASTCAPVMVASAQDNPSHLAVDDTHLFWRRGPTSAGSIARVRKDGTAAASDLIGMIDGQGALASDGTHLYYFGNRNVFSCEVPTCRAPLRLAPTMPTMSLGVDIIDVHLNPSKAKVFWTDQAKIYSVGVAGGVVQTHLTGNFPSVSLALDIGHIYYVERDPANQVSVQKLTAVPPPARGPVVDLISGMGTPRQLAVTADRLLWVANSFVGSIALNSPSRMPPAPIATGNPTRMAVEGSTIFWGDFASATSGRIFSCSTAGCGGPPPPALAATCGPNYLAADATTVYWICVGTGTVWKVAR